MIGMNLVQLRKRYNMTQEMVAERIHVSRQTIAKWENDESIPDIINCAALAKLFDVTVDNLICYSPDDSGLQIPPRGKHFFGSVTVGERGQIVIPKKAREMFSIAPGDQLMIFGDEERGLGIVHQRDLLNFVSAAGMNSSESKQKGGGGYEKK